MNPVTDLLNKRLAVRSISTESIPEEMINDLMETVRLTPSCYNKQPWRFLFLESREAQAKGHQALTAGNLKWAPRAPLLIVGYSRAEDDCITDDGRQYHQFDLGMAVMNLILSATHLNLVARPMAGFDPAKINELFELKEVYRPLVMIAVGFPSDDESHLPDFYKGLGNKPRVRKDAGEIISRL